MGILERIDLGRDQPSTGNPYGSRLDRSDWSFPTRNVELRLLEPVKEILMNRKPHLHIPRRPRRLAFLAVVIAVVAASVAVGTFAGGSTDGAPVQLAPGAGAVPVVDGTPSQVLATLAGRLPLVSNPSVAEVTIPPAPDPTAAGNPVAGLALSYDLVVDSTSGSDIGQAMWEGDLFVGAVADEFVARGFGEIVDVSGTLVTPNGARQAIGGGVGRVVREQVFDQIPGELGATVVRNAGDIGLRSVGVKTFSVLQGGVLVIDAVSDSPVADVSALLSKGGLDFLLGQSPANFEGVFLEIDDRGGNPVYTQGAAPRDGAGNWWATPSLGFNENPRSRSLERP
jgi:hypothetical protein